MKKTIPILILIILLAGCTTIGFVPADDTGFTSQGLEDLSSANNLFAIEFYHNITSDDSGNIFYSPYSLTTAFSMLYEGAGGETASEMQGVFHLLESDVMRRSSNAKKYNELNVPNNDYELRTANAFWAQQDYPFLEEYVSIVENYYRGSATSLDFINNPEGSRQTINEWVEEQTNNKIQDLIPSGVIRTDTRFVLTNAVYFKGTWVKQFNEDDTIDEEFNLDGGGTVTVPMMRMTGDEAEYKYAETEDLQILEMDYEGDKISMIILLPKNGMVMLEDELTLENLENWTSMLVEQRVNVYIPRFTFETKYFLVEKLASMGMPTVFSWPGADLSGMDGTTDLYVSQVIHQAFVDVNEEGTEAAAATAIIGTLGSAIIDVKTFRADHPFIFIIKEKNNDNILFMGRMMNPNI